MTTTQRCADCQHPKTFHPADGALCVGYQHSPLARCVCTQFTTPGSTAPVTTVWTLEVQPDQETSYTMAVFTTVELAMQAAEQHCRADMIDNPSAYDPTLLDPRHQFKWKELRTGAMHYLRVNQYHTYPNYTARAEPIMTHVDPSGTFT